MFNVNYTNIKLHFVGTIVELSMISDNFYKKIISQWGKEKFSSAKNIGKHI